MDDKPLVDPGVLKNVLNFDDREVLYWSVKYSKDFHKLFRNEGCLSLETNEPDHW